MRSGIRYTIVGAAALVLVPMLTLDVPAILRAQEPTPAPAGAAAPAQGEGEAEAGEPMAAGPEMRALVTLIDQTLPDINSIKPLPEMAIPDPPPHEGAMIDHSLTIQPPDLIQVEFLETLPGRPISGEQLVRPDGTITLGFYGDVHVRGLTLEQAKTKIILHMRMYLTDEALGLIGSPMYKPALEVAAPDAPIPPPPPPPPAEGAGGAGAPAAKLDDEKNDLPPLPKDANPFDLPRDAKPAEPPAPRPARAVDPNAPVGEGDVVVIEVRPIPGPPATMILIAPADSDRVLVDIASHNSRFYFVLGEVTAPGRLPITGRETVLDSIQFVGSLTPDADPQAIKLVRPARGDQPARVYPIDLAAIQDRGDATANLQLFAGDRLVVGRKAAVQQTILVNDAIASRNTMMNSVLTYAFMMRAVANIATPYGATGNEIKPGAPDPARFREVLKNWAGMIEDPALREEILKQFQDTPPG